jgi:hypothetical protein
MKPEPYKLAPLVIAYYEKFGDHLAEAVLRKFDAGELAPILQVSLATGVPISEADWCYDSTLEYPPGGCIIREENA